MPSVMWNFAATTPQNTLSNFSAPKTKPSEKVQVHHLQLVQITEQYVWPCLVFSNYTELINSLGSVLPEEKWSEVQKKLSLELQRHVMSKHTQMNAAAAAGTPVYFLLGATPPCGTRSIYSTEGNSACYGSEAFNVVMSDLLDKGVFHNEKFQEASEQMMKISQMATHWSQEALQEPPLAPVATHNAEITEKSKPLEATLVMDEDESLAGVGKGKKEKPKQAPTEPKDAAFETPGAAAARIEGDEAPSVGPLPENPPVQEDETEHPIEEIDQADQQNDDEEMSGESSGAASATASAMDLDSQSVNSTSRKQKCGKKRKGKTTSKGSAAPKRAKSNSPPQLDEDEGTEIPTFTKAKPLLKKAGYTFRKGVYCRPKGDPKEYPNAVEGNDYFATESAFREFICRAGVDCNGLEWTSDEKEYLTRWIRYSVIKSIKDETTLPANRLTHKDALNLLRKNLEFHFCSKTLVEGYMLPGVPYKEAKYGVDKFQEKPDLWVYLARHGLPKNCPFEKISPSKRLALEHFIADIDFDSKKEKSERKDLDLYNEYTASEAYRTAKEEKKSSPDSARDSASEVQSPRDGKSDESSIDRSPASDNYAITASNRAPSSDKKSSPIRPGRTLQYQLDRTLDKQPTEKTLGMVADSGAAEMSDSEQESAVEVNTTQKSTRTRASKKYVKDVKEKCKIKNKKHPPTEKPRLADKDGTRKELPTLPTSPPKPLPDLETTVGAKLQKCKEMLKLASGEITFGGEHSKTTARVQQIMQFFDAVIESKGEHGLKRGEPAALHVCGVPGAGKTLAVDWCCKKALELAKESAEEWDKAPTFCRINGSHYQNLTKKRALDDVKEAISTSMGQTFSENVVKRSKIAEKSTVVLVIDEIDLLVSDKSETFLSTLLGWASNEQMAFGIIGISNHVESSKARRLHSLGGFKNKIVFQTYDKDELVSIVQSRIGSTIVDTKVIEFIASKVAATSGDARKVLEMTSKAIDKCIEKMPKTRRDSSEEGIIVKLPFAMMAIRENMTKYADMINGLTTMGKSILCVATRLARHVDSSELTLGTLKNYCMDAFGHDAMLDEVSMEDFKSVVENLVDGGLLCVAECDRKRLSTESFHSLSMIPIRLDLQLEDVESAVEEELLKYDFYSSLLARLASGGRR